MISFSKETIAELAGISLFRSIGFVIFVIALHRTQLCRNKSYAVAGKSREIRLKHPPIFQLERSPRDLV